MVSEGSDSIKSRRRSPLDTSGLAALPRPGLSRRTFPRLSDYSLGILARKNEFEEFIVEAGRPVSPI